VSADLLSGRRVLAHPFIIGELACGNLGEDTEETLGDILPMDKSNIRILPAS
jgi:hypothetical protein